MTVLINSNLPTAPLLTSLPKTASLFRNVSLNSLDCRRLPFVPLVPPAFPTYRIFVYGALGALILVVVRFWWILGMLAELAEWPD